MFSVIYWVGSRGTYQALNEELSDQCGKKVALSHTNTIISIIACFISQFACGSYGFSYAVVHDKWVALRITVGISLVLLGMTYLLFVLFKKTNTFHLEQNE